MQGKQKYSLVSRGLTRHTMYYINKTMELRRSYTLLCELCNTHKNDNMPSGYCISNDRKITTAINPLFCTDIAQDFSLLLLILTLERCIFGTTDLHNLLQTWKLDVFLHMELHFKPWTVCGRLRFGMFGTGQHHNFTINLAICCYSAPENCSSKCWT